MPVSSKAHQGYLWVANAPGGCLFYHRGVGSGANQLVETLGKTFCGYIQCDGCGAYKAHAKSNPGANPSATLTRASIAAARRRKSDAV